MNNGEHYENLKAALQALITLGETEEDVRKAVTQMLDCMIRQAPVPEVFGSTPADDFNDMDVFDGMRTLLAKGVDLDNWDAVVDLLPIKSARYVNWCIKAAKAHRAVVSREGVTIGFVPPE